MTSRALELAVRNETLCHKRTDEQTLSDGTNFLCSPDHSAFTRVLLQVRFSESGRFLNTGFVRSTEVGTFLLEERDKYVCCCQAGIVTRTAHSGCICSEVLRKLAHFTCSLRGGKGKNVPSACFCGTSTFPLHFLCSQQDSTKRTQSFSVNMKTVKLSFTFCKSSEPMRAD